MPIITRLRSGAGKRRNYAAMAGKRMRKPRAPVAKLSKPIKAAVKRLIKSNEETKFVSYCPVNNVAHNSTISAGDFYRVLPHVFQGATEYQRVGDKLNPQSLTVKGTVAINRDIINQNRAIMVRILVLQLKQAHDYTSASTAWAANYTQLLKQNDETGVENIAFNGNQNELYLPVNRDMFDVLGERFIKLTQLNQLNTSVEAAPVNAIARNFNLRLKKVPKTLHYSTGGSNEPTNYAPFMCFGYAYMDGNGPDTMARVGIEVNAQSHLYFKDA